MRSPNRWPTGGRPRERGTDRSRGETPRKECLYPPDTNERAAHSLSPDPARPPEAAGWRILAALGCATLGGFHMVCRTHAWRFDGYS